MADMRVDSHLHAGFRGFSPERIIAYLDAERLDLGWLLTWEEDHPVIPSQYQHLSVAEVFSAYERFPSRIVPMYAPDPAKPGFREDLRFWHARGIRGIGELKVSCTWDSAPVGALLEEARALGLPVVFHMEGPGYFPFPWSLPNRVFTHTLNRGNRLGRRLAGQGNRRGYFPGYLPDFGGLRGRLAEFPELAFIGHGPLFWKGIAREQGNALYPSGKVGEPGILCDLLARYPNLHADLSGRGGYNALARDPGFARDLLSAHSRQVLFGTDNFSLGLPALLADLGLAPADLDRILGGNAVALVPPRAA